MPTLTTNGTGRHSAGFDSLGTLQMLEVAQGILPREYTSWDEINPKVPKEWRDGKAAGQVDLSTISIPEDSMLRTPSAIEGEGGAIREDVAREKGRMLMVRDQMAQLAADNGLKVSASLLPTPTVVDMGGNKTVEEWEEWTDAQREKHGNGNGHGNSLNIEALKLLPTPNTMDSLPARTPEQLAEAKERTAAGFSNLRESVVNDLLPTVTTQDGKNNGGPSQHERNTKPLNALVSDLLGTPRASASNPSSAQMGTGAPKGRLEDQVVGAERGLIAWGKFEPAIRRWENVTGRPAPAPTLPDGKDGAHRLSALFTEWMMGLPEGWITGADVGRVAELKMAGNGVVPQQAAYALRKLFGLPTASAKDATMLPTPTASDQRDGKHLRSVAVENLKNGKNRGIGLNHLVENIGLDWEEGDTFTVIDGKAQKVGE